MTFEFFYITDLDPLPYAQVVDISGSSFSIYGETQPVKTASTSFTTTFLNPCTDPAFVTITPTA